MMEPGEERTYELEFGVLAGGAEIDAFADRPSQLELPDDKLPGFKAIVAEMDALAAQQAYQ